MIFDQSLSKLHTFDVSCFFFIITFQINVFDFAVIDILLQNHNS